jgi:Flp pilus assembly protein TadD
MKGLMIGALGVVALALSGCATLNSQEAFQNAAAQKQECKVVALHSASDSLRLQNQKGRDGDAMERTEGSLDIGHVNLNPPRGLRTTLPPLERTTSQLQRDC